MDTNIGETMPYPGVLAWYIDSSGRAVNNILIDESTGRAVDRDNANYIDPEVSVPSSYVLDNNYTVIIDTSSL